MTSNHIIRRVSAITLGMGLGLSLFTSTASAAPKADKGSNAPAQSSARQDCNGTHHSDTGHGANTDGPGNQYHNTCDGSASENGNGGGEAKGKPCAGCVGNADDKNPPGQADNGNDHNHGYECDVKGQPNGGNNGVGKGNPAHTGCAPAADANQTPPSKDDDHGKPKDDDHGQPAKDDDHGKPKDDDHGKPTVDNTDDHQGPCAGGAMTTDVNGDGVVDAKDCNPVPAPTCPNGTMMTDVNGDGLIDSRDCRPASVLGNELDRTSSASEVRAATPVVRASRGNRPTEVLGVEFSRGADVASLALTGAPVDPSQLLLVAIALLAGGTVLLQGRRRPTKSS